MGLNCDKPIRIGITYINLTDLLALYLPEDLAQILNNHPERLQVIKAWPQVPPELQRAIIRMIGGDDIPIDQGD